LKKVWIEGFASASGKLHFIGPPEQYNTKTIVPSVSGTDRSVPLPPKNGSVKSRRHAAPSMW
jgi:hypothetical protein